MNRLFRPVTLAWMLLTFGSIAWLVFADARRVANRERLGEYAPAAAADDTSVTGYARGVRNLILPVNRAESQQWIIEVQKMMAANSWRALRGDFDNAPEGRDLTMRAPYRWWLRLVATVDHARSGASTGRSVERAALRAGPALHLLLALGGSLLVAWRFGLAPGGFFAAGIAVLFAPTLAFAPGRPEAQNLFLAVNLVGLLLVLCGWHSALKGRSVVGWFTVAGAASGLGLWIDAGSQVTVLAAMGMGYGAAALLAPSNAQAAIPKRAWRSWAAAGIVVASIGWFVEGKPSAPGLATNHPVLWLAWLGLAETLTQLPILRRGKAGRAQQLALAAGLVALTGSIGWRLYQGGLGEGFGPGEPAFTSASTFAGWLREEKLGLRPVSLLVALSLIPAALWWCRRSAPLRSLACASVVTALALLVPAWSEVRWWDLLLVAWIIVLVVVSASVDTSRHKMRWFAGLGCILGLVLIAGWPKSNQGGALAPAEAHALIERDLGQWLASRAEPWAVVLAPPNLSGALCYYGGLRVIGSPYIGNDKGRALVERIAAADSPDEAQSMAQSRNVHFIVLPSWDDSLERLAAASVTGTGKPLIGLLRTWLPPRWLRPVPYLQPVIPGLEQTSVVVFEVVEPQENTVALSRLANYFIETGNLNLAQAVAESLATSFAADVGGLIVRAEVAIASGDKQALAQIIAELLPAIADGRDEDLSWERRAHLARVLAQLKRTELARPQVEFCVQEADQERLRQLGPTALYQFLTLARAYRLNFAEPELDDYARSLLPPEFRAQLQP